MEQLKCAQPETLVEVDLTILDFLSFQATNALFKEQSLKSSNAQIKDDEFCLADNDLQMAHSFSDLFLHNHPDGILPETISFRFNLMRFLEIFTRQTSQINDARISDLLKSFSECIISSDALKDSTILEYLADLTPEQLQATSETKLADLLIMMHEALPLPVLTQLERGQVDGLTADETEELKKKAGWLSCT